MRFSRRSSAIAVASLLLIAAPLATTALTANAAGSLALHLARDLPDNSGEILQPLVDGTNLELSQIDKPNIWATPKGKVGSVKFCIDGVECRFEINDPYGLHDVESPTKWSPAPGTHTVEAASFASADATGTPIERATVTFTVGGVSTAKPVPAKKSKRAVVRGKALPRGTSLPSASPTAPSLPTGGKAPVGSKLIWAADYETGDFSQWDHCQAVDDCGGSSMEILSAPYAREGNHAAKFVIHDGDTPIDSGERSEVSGTDDDPSATHEGDELFYEISLFFPDNFPTPDGEWFIVTQWHSSEGSPPVAIEVNSDDMLEITERGADFETIGPIKRGQWVDYVLHVKFSSDRSTGFMEVWEDGQLKLKKTPMATMASETNYIKHGIYRDPDASGTAEVWIDNFRITAV